jgi:hypothetical protein
MKEKKEKELSLQLLVHVQMGLIPRHHHWPRWANLWIPSHYLQESTQVQHLAQAILKQM